MSREPSTRVCWTVATHQHRALQGLALTSGVPAAELARRALDRFLVSQLDGYVPKPLRGGAHAGESAPNTTRSTF